MRFEDLGSKPQPLFHELVETLSIKPYRFLLEDRFGPLIGINCCSSAGKGKGSGKLLPPMQARLDFLASRTFQLQMQEPNMVDC